MSRINSNYTLERRYMITEERTGRQIKVMSVIGADQICVLFPGRDGVEHEYIALVDEIELLRAVLRCAIDDASRDTLN